MKFLYSVMIVCGVLTISTVASGEDVASKEPSATMEPKESGGFWRLSLGLGEHFGKGIYGNGLQADNGYHGMAAGGSMALGGRINKRWDAHVAIELTGTVTSLLSSVFGEPPRNPRYESIGSLSSRMLSVMGGGTYYARKIPTFVSVAAGPGHHKVKSVEWNLMGDFGEDWSWEDLKQAGGKGQYQDTDWGLAIRLEGGYLWRVKEHFANGISLSYTGLYSFDDPKPEMVSSLLFNYVIQLD